MLSKRLSRSDDEVEANPLEDTTVVDDELSTVKGPRWELLSGILNAPQLIENAK